MARFTPDGGTGSGPATPSYLPTVSSGVVLGTTADLGRVAQSAGAAVALAPATLRMPETAGVGATGLYSGASTPAQSSGVAQSVVADLGRPAQGAGAEVVQITYNLTSTWPSNSASAAINSGSVNWATPTSAQGNPDSAAATLAATLTNAADATLTMNYPDSVNKGPLAITGAQLKVFWKLSALGVLQTATVTLKYNIGAGLVTLATRTAAFDSFAAGETFTLPTLTWAQVDAFVATVTGVLSSNATSATLSVDAAQLIVTASVTDAL